MDYNFNVEDYQMVGNIISYGIRFVVWGLIGYVMGKKAKNVGLSFGLYFTLTFLLGLIGLAITWVKINNRKKEIAMSQMYQQQNMYGAPGQAPYQQAQNPYQQGQNPYQQQNAYQQPQNPYQQQNAYQQPQNPYQQQNTYQQPQNTYQQQNAYQQPQNTYQQDMNAGAGTPVSPFGARTCPECGNTQSQGSFCNVCGAKL